MPYLSWRGRLIFRKSAEAQLQACSGPPSGRRQSPRNHGRLWLSGSPSPAWWPLISSTPGLKAGKANAGPWRKSSLLSRLGQMAHTLAPTSVYPAFP